MLFLPQLFAQWLKIGTLVPWQKNRSQSFVLPENPHRRRPARLKGNGWAQPLMNKANTRKQGSKHFHRINKISRSRSMTCRAHLSLDKLHVDLHSLCPASLFKRAGCESGKAATMCQRLQRSQWIQRSSVCAGPSSRCRGSRSGDCVRNSARVCSARRVLRPRMGQNCGELTRSALRKPVRTPRESGSPGASPRRRPA